MGFSRRLRPSLAVLLSVILTGRPAHALVNIDEGRNQLFVSANFNAGYDSNLFGNSEGGGDVLYALDLTTQFVRRAGWIGLNASAGVNATRYGKYTSENFQNPHLNAEFTKQTGRTTGALTFAAARQSRADTAANMRSDSWNYNAGLNFKYPVIERYSFSGNLAYSLTDYADNTVFVDLQSYTAGLDLYYVFTTDRDLLAGYRYRRDETPAGDPTTDHSFTVGVTGKILPRLNGSIRTGYSYRIPEGRRDEAFSSWTANASATWSFSKRLNATAQLGKDFSTTSTNISVDSLTMSLNSQYSLNSKTTLTGGVSWGSSAFLGNTGGGRRDTYWTWNVGVNRTLNDHLKLSLSYAHFENSSTNQFSIFARRSINFMASAFF